MELLPLSRQNIISLLRNGGQDQPINQPVAIDNLTYQYIANTNQLLTVNDSSNSTDGFKDIASLEDYHYDNFGNQTKDDNKGITEIKYNHLNLPTQIIFTTTPTVKKITYLYDASGDKLQKVVTEGPQVITTDYLDGFQYRNAVLQFFPHAEGYVVNTQTTTINGVRVDNYNYVYNYLDHLGNVRVSYTWDIVTNGLKIIEENGYYPYGLKHSGYNSDLNAHKAVANETKVELRGVPSGGSGTVETSINQVRFNHREWQNELGLNVTDMDFRQYDNAIGRFVCTDPITHFNQSPYHFANNNPMFWADPSGMDGITITIDWNSIPDTVSGPGLTIDFLHSWEEVDNAEGDVYVFGQDGSVNLPAVTVGFNFSTGQYASNAGSVIQQHVYNNSPYYQSDFVSTGKKINDYFGLGLAPLELIPGTVRFNTATKLISPKYYANGWNGNQFASTAKVASISRVLGLAGLGIGTYLDYQGVKNFYDPKYGPNSENSVNPAKAGLNLGMGTYGLFVNPIPSIMYSGIDAFYPGGWDGALGDQARLNQENRAINPSFQLFPGALKL